MKTNRMKEIVKKKNQMKREKMTTTMRMKPIDYRKEDKKRDSW